jgi:hypothetical protein
MAKGPRAAPLGGIQRAIAEFDDPVCPLQENGPRLGEFHSAGRSAEQLGADLLLESVYAPGEWWLREVQASGGAAQVPFLGHRYEAFQLAWVQYGHKALLCVLDG